MEIKVLKHKNWKLFKKMYNFELNYSNSIGEIIRLDNYFIAVFKEKLK